jgi:Domain of unknown function DUF29
MEEILQLRDYLETQRYGDALSLIGEMEEMALDDKLHKISSYAVVLLVHLIKQAVEQRTTRSWDNSIRNSVEEIAYVNKRRKSGGYFATTEDVREILNYRFKTALRKAADEALEGKATEAQLEALLDKEILLEKALCLILDEQKLNEQQE